MAWIKFYALHSLSLYLKMVSWKILDAQISMHLLWASSRAIQKIKNTIGWKGAKPIFHLKKTKNQQRKFNSKLITQEVKIFT